VGCLNDLRETRAWVGGLGCCGVVAHGGHAVHSPRKRGV